MTFSNPGKNKMEPLACAITGWGLPSDSTKKKKKKYQTPQAKIIKKIIHPRLIFPLKPYTKHLDDIFFPYFPLLHALLFLYPLWGSPKPKLSPNTRPFPLHCNYYHLLLITDSPSPNLEHPTHAH